LRICCSQRILQKTLTSGLSPQMPGFGLKPVYVVCCTKWYHDRFFPSTSAFPNSVMSQMLHNNLFVSHWHQIFHQLVVLNGIHITS